MRISLFWIEGLRYAGHGGQVPKIATEPEKAEGRLPFSNQVTDTPELSPLETHHAGCGEGGPRFAWNGCPLLLSFVGQGSGQMRQ